MDKTAKSFKHLYLDVETTVDFDLEERWGFPAILPESAFKPPEEVAAMTVDGVKTYLAEFDPLAINPEWGTKVWDAENAKAKKARSTVLDRVHKAIGHRDSIIGRFPLDPQLCRIASIAYAIDDDPVQSLIGGNGERDLLMVTWDLMSGAQYLVGWKIIGFDLPVIFGRSLQQGLKATRPISMRKYGNPDVIDLKLAIWQKDTGVKGLKQTARHFGIDIPAGADVDGSQVGLMTIDQLLAYNESDVEVTRNLHWLAAGMYGLEPVAPPEITAEDERPF
jgi:hypothetical protein